MFDYGCLMTQKEGNGDTNQEMRYDDGDDVRIKMMTTKVNTTN